ncbi:MAG: hypothetical protein EAY75_09240 [Bacteroidetes bacterium]|nr:MAG: hypothetical protein EAY75_09240 [Bacteroidota bacterium]
MIGQPFLKWWKLRRRPVANKQVWLNDLRLHVRLHSVAHTKPTLAAAPTLLQIPAMPFIQYLGQWAKINY